MFVLQIIRSIVQTWTFRAFIFFHFFFSSFFLTYVYFYLKMFPSEGYFYLKCQKNGLVVSVNNEEKVQLQKKK